MAVPAQAVMASQPKTVVLNPATGDIISVAYGAVNHPAITEHDTCDPDWACYESGEVPYANMGFSGSAGTKTGTWLYRYDFSTGNYSARACYIFSGSSHCTPEEGPGTIITFDDDLVTGTSVTIY